MQYNNTNLDVPPQHTPSPELMTEIQATLYCNVKDTAELEKKVQQYCKEEWMCTFRCPVGEVYEIRITCIKADVGGEKFEQVLKEKLNDVCGYADDRKVPPSRIQLNLAWADEWYFTREYDFELSQSK